MTSPQCARSLLLAEILALRKSLWEKVASRVHNPIKIFPYGPNSNEVMLHGTVKYGLKAGGESSLDWAAYARLVKEGGKVKMEFYQVYLVSINIREMEMYHGLIEDRILVRRVSKKCQWRQRRIERDRA